MEQLSSAVLAHYGVKGMKWGVRKGSLKSRVSDAQKERTERTTDMFKKVKRVSSSSKKSDKAKYLLATGLVGQLAKPLIQKSLNKTISSLEKRSSRIESGKLNTMDKLDKVLNTTPVSVVFTRTPKKRS